MTNLHCYKVNCFLHCSGLQFQEFNDLCTEVNTDLLNCMASLTPVNFFCEFEQSKLLRLVKFYHGNFSFGKRLSINNVRNNETV